MVKARIAGGLWLVVIITGGFAAFLNARNWETQSGLLPELA